MVLMIHSVLAEIVYRAAASKLHSFKSYRLSYPCGSHVQKECYFATKALSDSCVDAASTFVSPESVSFTIRVNLFQLTLKHFRSFSVYFLPYCEFITLVKLYFAYFSSFDANVACTSMRVITLDRCFEILM